MIQKMIFERINNKIILLKLLLDLQESLHICGDHEDVSMRIEDTDFL